MARRQSADRAAQPEPAPSQAPAPIDRPSETDRAPAPPIANRMVKSADDRVRVRANIWVGEDGIAHAPGDEFTITRDRARALGPIVTVLGILVAMLMQSSARGQAVRFSDASSVPPTNLTTRYPAGPPLFVNPTTGRLLVESSLYATNVGATLLNTNVGATLLNTNVGATLLNTNVGATLLNTNVGATLLNTNVGATLLNTNVGATLLDTNVGATILNAISLADTNVGATLLNTNVGATLLNTNVGATLLDTNVGATILNAISLADTNVGATVLGTASVSLPGIIKCAIEFQRPDDATGYTAGDVIANSDSAPTIITLTNAARSAGLGGYITGVRWMTRQPTNTAAIRAHFFSSSSILHPNDNAAFSVAETNRSDYIGYADVSTIINAGEFAHGAAVSGMSNLPLPFQSVGTDLYAVLETRNAWTPVNLQTNAITVLIERN